MNIIEGKVIHRLYAPNSKSEHQAVMIITQDGEFLLRRMGGNPFYDEVLQGLIGQRISGVGRLTPTTAILDDWKII